VQKKASATTQAHDALVEDNLGDARLAIKALKDGKTRNRITPVTKNRMTSSPHCDRTPDTAA